MKKIENYRLLKILMLDSTMVSISAGVLFIKIAFMDNLTYVQLIALSISVVGINTFFPFVLYKCWLSYRKNVAFDLLDTKWGFTSFIISCLSVILMFIFFTIPSFVNMIVT